MHTEAPTRMQARAVSRANARNRGNMQIYDATVVERFLEEVEESPGSDWRCSWFRFVDDSFDILRDVYCTVLREWNFVLSHSEEFRLVRILY